MLDNIPTDIVVYISDYLNIGELFCFLSSTFELWKRDTGFLFKKKDPLLECLFLDICLLPCKSNRFLFENLVSPKRVFLNYAFSKLRYKGDDEDIMYKLLRCGGSKKGGGDSEYCEMREDYKKKNEIKVSENNPERRLIPTFDDVKISPVPGSIMNISGFLTSGRHYVTRAMYNTKNLTVVNEPILDNLMIGYSPDARPTVDNSIIIGHYAHSLRNNELVLGSYHYPIDVIEKEGVKYLKCCVNGRRARIPIEFDD